MQVGKATSIIFTVQNIKDGHKRMKKILKPKSAPIQISSNQPVPPTQTVTAPPTVNVSSSTPKRPRLSGPETAPSTEPVTNVPTGQSNQPISVPPHTAPSSVLPTNVPTGQSLNVSPISHNSQTAPPNDEISKNFEVVS